MNARPTTFGVADAKARFSELLDRAECGETIIIRRHGKAIAQLVPVKAKKTLEERREAHRKFIEWRSKHGPTLGPDITIKELINEGRR